MKIFVYEYVTGGGMWSAGELPAGSLLREGSAMVHAVASDFSALAGLKVLALRDARLRGFELPGAQLTNVGSAAEESQAIAELSRAADATLVIAPEFDGILEQRARWVAAAGGKLISPGAETIALAADKQRACELLANRGVPVPSGTIARKQMPLPAEFRWPAVLKPRDGAGSLGVRRIESLAVLEAVPDWEGQRLESFCAGIAASCAVLCGPAGNVALAPCRQLLGGDSGFDYLGGELPLPPSLASRARELALRAVAALPAAVGYLGVDLVLGAACDGSEDFAIEVNPRLTTSYVGLRQACEQNLAQAMLDIAAGRTVALSFRPERLEFTAVAMALEQAGSNRLNRGEMERAT
jgi:predicted ATP-grasp superfamily ATP-dependent carboligase